VRIFSSLDEFAKAAGEHLGYSDWHEITQERINLFADATDDHQWIHVDTERAARGPFGKTIAHGFLTLSLLPVLNSEIYRVENLTMGVNYGLDKLRFPATVPVGSRVRAGITLREIKQTERGSLVYNTVTVEVEGQDKPCCVAETVTLLVP
jgi:acyl dehydratase